MSGPRKPYPRFQPGISVLGAVLAVTLPLASPAGAQNTGSAQGALGEIIVTAQHREENLQEVPISVTAMTAESLENVGVSATSAITQAVPAVQFTRSGPSGMFFMRGVGTTNGAAGEEGANVFYVDGVYMPDLFSTIMNFNNIERVEVLKGPQGTLFGRNAFGGLIHVITRDPSDGLAMNARAGYGKYETWNGQFYAGGPLTDTLAMDIALTGQDQGKGWGDNFTRHEESKQEKYWGARSKVVFKPSDDLKFTLAGDAYELKDNTALAWRIADGYLGTGGYPSPGGQDTTSDEASLTTLRISGLNLTIEADLGFATLTSISAARQTDNHSSFDVDGGPLPLIRMKYVSGIRSLQQELRLASNDPGPLSWQTGMFWLHTKVESMTNLRGTAFGGSNHGLNIDARMDPDSWAVFGEVTYALTDNTHLTGGIRYTEDARRLDASQASVTAGVPGASAPYAFDPGQRYDTGTYRIALRHDLTDDINVYASWNRGFKAGTYNLQALNNPGVQPMYIDAYEVGLKSEWLDRRLRVNVAAYHYDLDDYQVRSTSTSPGTGILLNSGAAEIDGIDVEFEAAPIDRLSLYGGFTVLDARYKKFGTPGVTYGAAPFNYPRTAVNTNTATTCDPAKVGTASPNLPIIGPPTGGLVACAGNAKGNDMAMSPDFSGSIGATYTIPLEGAREVRLSALYNYNSGYYFEPDETTGQDQFHIINASVEYALDEHWSFALWGKNLTDDEYLAQVASTATGAFATLGPPRTYGVSVSYNY